MKCVGDTSNMFIRFISNQIAEYIPPYHLSWGKVPQELKDLVYPEIHHYFDIDSYRNTPLWESVKVSINKDCAERYKDRKNTLKEHFELHGGYDDLEQARAHTPTGIEESVWIETIEKLFLDTSYRHRSKVNSENRAKQPYGSYQGTSSMAARRYKKAQESTEEPSLIDAWKDTHHKEGSGWINERAADDYRKLDEARRRKRASSSTGFVDEAQILKEVLGEQRGHMKGIGRKIKRVSHYPDFTTPSGTQQDQMKEWFAQRQEYNETVMQALRIYVPNFQPPPMPTFLSNRSEHINEVNDDETPENQD